MRRQHDARVQHAGKRTIFDLHRVNRRDQDSADDVVHNSRCDERSRAVRAHAACVGTAIMIPGSLVILRDIQGHDRVAINQCENAGFMADQTFFDHDLRTRFSEGAVLQNGFHGSASFSAIGTDEDTFASCQTIGLDDQRLLFAVFEILHCFGHPAEDGEICRGNIGSSEQLLGEDLAAFKASSRGCRTKHVQVLAAKFIDNSGHQRRFGANDSEIDLVVFRKLRQTHDVVCRNVQVLSILRGAGVSRCAIDFFDER